MTTALQANAFAGALPERLDFDLDSKRLRRWLTRRPFIAASMTHMGGPPARSDFRNFRDRRVGWGIVTRPGLVLPAIVQELRDQRGAAPLFWFRGGSGGPYSLCTDEGEPVALESPLGVDRGHLPYYLMILGGPADVPWRLQYVLSASRCVGRVHLEGEALENYIGALLRDFAGSQANPRRTAIWAADHGGTDVTRLLRDAVSEKVHAAYTGYDDYRAGTEFLDGASSDPGATGEALVRCLELHRPALVATTSHGAVGPLHDPAAMLASLGLPVDQDCRPLDLSRLLRHWQPSGAIWYAHACNSAGCDAFSSFEGLFPEGSEMHELLVKVASLGAHVSPLATTLLGAQQPLRAFIGHVEPTFDWTLRHPQTHQDLSHPIVSALCEGLPRGEPVAEAFRPWHSRTGVLRASLDAALEDYKRSADNTEELFYLQLAARDTQGTVILGDPAVSLPH